MIKRLLHALFAVWLGMFACNAAHAQVGTILMHVFGSMLQGQIDAWDKANDPNRGLREFNAKDNFSGRDLYAPGSLQKFEGSYESGGFIRNGDTARPSYEATTVGTEPAPAPLPPPPASE